MPPVMLRCYVVTLLRYVYLRFTRIKSKGGDVPTCIQSNKQRAIVDARNLDPFGSLSRLSCSASVPVFVPGSPLTRRFNFLLQQQTFIHALGNFCENCCSSLAVFSARIFLYFLQQRSV